MKEGEEAGRRAGAKRLLIVALERLERDIRIQKQIATLAREFDVTVAAYSPPPGEMVEIIGLRREPLRALLPWLARGALGRAPRLRLSVASLLPGLRRLDRFDGVLCNDVKSLPMGAWLKRRWNCALILDAHEYAPADRAETRGAGKRARAVKLCKSLLPEVDGALTVSEGLANLYRQNFGLAAEVLPNVPRYRAHALHERVIERPYQLICHGIGARGRGIMELIELAPSIGPGWHLNLMLVPPSSRKGREHFELLRARAAASDHVTLREPVGADSVVEEISQYDAGIYLMPGESLNKVHALPNKFFDFLQAGLAIFVGPELEEMSAFVRRSGCGRVAREHTPQAMGELLRGLQGEDLAEMKQRARAVAPQWCYEEFEGVLVDVVKRSLDKAGARSD